MTPTLTSSRLILRQLTKPKTLQLEWLRDKEIVRYSEQRHRTHTLSSQQAYINSFNGDYGNSHIWSINLATGGYIGNLTARHDANNDVADIGILVGEKSVWGQGYGPEAWQLATDWLLDRDGGDIRRLVAGCMKANNRMLGILHKCKWKFEAERPGHYLLDGNPMSVVYYARVR